jgi:hypothetical protein
MGNLEQYRAATRGTVSRSTGRALTRVQDQTWMALAVVEAEADIHAAKVDAVGFVAQRGMQDVAFLSQVEQTLSQTVPLAASRLQAIGDLATLGIGQVITDTVSELRRL